MSSVHQGGSTAKSGAAVEAAARTEQRRLAQLFLPRTEAVSADMQGHLLAAVPGLNPDGGERAATLIRESSDQTVGMLFSTMAFGLEIASCEPAEGTIELLRETVAAGGDATVILYCFRIGHRRLWEAWTEHVAQHVDDPECLQDVLRVSSTHFFAYIDRMCERVSEIHRRDLRPGDVGDGPATRSAIIDRLLGPGAADVTFPAGVLGYDLAAHHVGLVLSPTTEHADVTATLGAVVRAAGRPRVLQRSRSDRTHWAWMGFTSRPSAAVLEAIGEVVAPDVVVGVGAHGAGRDGFRTTHEQAMEAVDTARLGVTASAGGVVHHEDVELAALLCADRARAERLVATRLGVLAGTDETCRRLRETLRVYIATGRSKVRTAAELHVHQKTVTYRVNQAEELLGRPVGQSTAELDAALRIHRTLHGA